VVTASPDSLLCKLEADLKDLLKIKWARALTSIVGLNVTRTNKGFQLFQQHLLNSVLDKHWDTGITAATPLPANYNATTVEDGVQSDSRRYLAVSTQPDICFAVNYLARFAAKPGPLHWKGVQHLINYLAGTRHLRLNLFPHTNGIPLKSFADASWGRQFARSTYGVSSPSSMPPYSGSLGDSSP
jgi:hypothetical protein